MTRPDLPRRLPGDVPRSRNYRSFWDGPQRLGGGVDRVLKHLNAPKADVVESVFSDWERLVGEVIAEHTTPTKIERGVLYLEVDNPAWASEMEWMSEELLRRISAMANTVEITAIRVQVAR